MMEHTMKLTHQKWHSRLQGHLQLKGFKNGTTSITWTNIQSWKLQHQGDYLGECYWRLKFKKRTVSGTLDRNGATIVNSHVPLSEMFGYATDLRSKTQGRTSYSMEFERYENVPKNISEKIVAERQGK